MKIQQPGAHLDHMLRQTRQHHVQLSSMADIKANLLITVASVVLTLCAPLAIGSELRWPAITLMGFCGLTIVLAIYVVMPKLPRHGREAGGPDVDSPKFNLHFFGDFTRLSYEQYSEEMEKVLNNPDRAYESMVREIYTYGVFLQRRKYRWLRFAYAAFLAGVLCSLLVGALAGVGA